MKVLLSHSTRDKDFVSRLAAALTAASFERWLCEVDVGPRELRGVHRNRPADFVGRTAYLARLRDLLTGEDGDRAAL